MQAYSLKGFLLIITTQSYISFLMQMPENRSRTKLVVSIMPITYLCTPVTHDPSPDHQEQRSFQLQCKWEVSLRDNTV